MPVIDSLAELNEQIRRWDARDNERRINTRIRTVGQDFIDEQARLTPLPGERFDPGLVLYPRVDRSSLITVRMARYSVPARLIGRSVARWDWAPMKARILALKLFRAGAAARDLPRGRA